MANPVFYDIPVSQWIKVATGVTVGNILPLYKDADYVYTLRVTGGAAPTDGDLSEAKELQYDGAIIQASSAIDVYIAVRGTDDGRVRADL